MNVVYLTILVYIVILLPCIISDTRCPADGIVGCQCDYNTICYRSNYIGEDIPSFSESNTVYDLIVVILLPCIISDTRCPADGIVGCRCGSNAVVIIPVKIFHYLVDLIKFMIGL